MPPDNLLNEAGLPFSDATLAEAEQSFAAMSPAQRAAYRDTNASTIALSGHRRILIVSGPGTGKSTLFFSRLSYWLSTQPDARVYVTTFVRKLASDLEREIRNTNALTGEMKARVEVFTLHRFARSVVERNHGTSQWRYRPYVKMIGEFWKEVVWGDTIALAPAGDGPVEPYGDFEKQLHLDSYRTDGRWIALHDLYYRVCQFYNIAGFADVILRARDALRENATLLESSYFIVDEYQDFNPGEDGLLRQMDSTGRGILIAGDDDQVLYDQMKASSAALIRRLYASSEYANAMLPFCGRCSYHIAMTAAHFLANQGTSDRIRKVFVPINAEVPTDRKVRLVACATPATAVDYVAKFITEHSAELEQRRADLASFAKRDPYLLILSPSRSCRYLGPAKQQLDTLVATYRGESETYSDDYFRLLDYYLLAEKPADNFRFRKVLHYAGLTTAGIRDHLSNALASSTALSQMEVPEFEAVLQRAQSVKNILDTASDPTFAVVAVSEVVPVSDSAALIRDLTARPIGAANQQQSQELSDEDAERALEPEQTSSAVELMTITGAKGLSADHVLVLGFDNTNCSYVTPNALFVAMTRARQSLHLVTSLRAGGASDVHQYAEHFLSTSIECLKYTKSNRAESALDGIGGLKRCLQGWRRYSGH